MNLSLPWLSMVLRSPVVAPQQSETALQAATTPHAELEARAQRGDRDALEALLREHTPAMIRFAASFVARDEAPDMAQRSLERIVKNIAHFDPTRGRFKTWAMAITRNICIDHLRARREVLRNTTEALDPPDPAPHINPVRALENKESMVALEQALQTLPEGTRSALTLFHVHGESYDAIANILDVPRGTVMTWLHRGRKQLKDALQGYEHA